MGDNMESSIKMRVVKEAEIFLEKKTTVRGVASILGISKSTVHKDFIERLKEIDNVLYYKVMELLQYNKDVRHIRGGQATKKLYAQHKVIKS